MDQGQDRAEALYLERTLALARRQWQLAQQKGKDRETSISAAHLDMLENVAQDASGLQTAQGFDDLMELSQYTLSVLDQMSAREKGALTLTTLAKVMDSPYFARIDFLFPGETAPEKIYIGRAALMDQDTYTIYVHDWRAPISSVFYRFGLGKASYQAPEGVIQGEVTRKRQYEIHGGRLEYYFDAEVQITDAFLRQLLSGHASPKMKTIVETIQRDQDMAIRDMQSDVLLVQGAAGSGKTSIALHRIAYLLYQGTKSHLNAGDILILSPNRMFEEYISRVLPDLGENNVKTMLFEEVFRALLPGVNALSKSRCMEEWLSCPDKKRAALIKSAAAFKGSAAFVQILDRLVLEIPKKWIGFRDIDYAGQRVAWRELAKNAILNSKKIAPLGMRLKWLEQEILERVHALRKGRIQRLIEFAARYPEHALEVEAFARHLSIRESAAMFMEIRKFTQLDCLAIYRRLFGDRDAFHRLAKGLDLPENVEEIRCFTAARLGGERLSSDDAQALMYLHLRLNGCGDFRHFRQVVLDEAQDEHPLFFAVLREMFPYARFTILGDVNQTIGKQADASLYRQIDAMMGRERTTLMTLNKSFRCTMEIWRFSQQFLNAADPGQCFGRSGEEPAVHQAADQAQMDGAVIKEVLACRAKGHLSIGLITKTEREAFTLKRRLEDRLEALLIHEGAAAALSGTLILPIHLAKGLEFDAVLVMDADPEHYRTEDDKKLLYIACTRALHRLSVFCLGSVSPLLQVDSPATKEGSL